MHAVACARRIHNAQPHLLPGMLLASLPFVLGAASSANKYVELSIQCTLIVLLFCRHISSEGSQLLLSMLASCTTDTALVQQLVGIALHDKERLRAAAFRAMTIFINIRAGDNSGSRELASTMQRYIIPPVISSR